MRKVENFDPGLPADPLEALDELLARENLPWREVWGPGGVAIFPLVEPDPDAWEERASIMHAGQEMIELPDKPSEPMRTRLVSELDKPPPPIKFEDTAESRRLRSISRGD
jgi:hypothetical protein